MTTAAIVALLWAAAAPAPVAAQPDDARWLAAGSDLAAALATRPASLSRAALAGGRPSYLARLGRLVFRSPAVLGTRARALGLSCETCHAGGAVNRRFFVPGVSDRPGNVDVTHAFWRNRLDDGRDDPVNIPSLRGAYRTAPYGRDGRFAGLGSFARHVVTAEFDGRPPAPWVLDALVAYVQDLAFPPNPVLGPLGRLVSDAAVPARRGEILFERDCAGCHLPSAGFVDGRGHDVGTGGRFDTPTILGAAETAPYFHDGRAADMTAAVGHFERLLGLDYSDGERADLIAYLGLVSAAPPAEPVTVTSDIADVTVFAALLERPLQSENSALVEDVADMVRWQLGRVHDRFRRRTHGDVRTLLVSWSRGLQDIAARARSGAFPAARDLLARWQEDVAAGLPRLEAAAGNSLYDPRELVAGR